MLCPSRSRVVFKPIVRLVGYFLFVLSIALLIPIVPSPIVGQDSLTPFAEADVPQNVVDLWATVDARKDALETRVVKEWIEDGVVCRYVNWNGLKSRSRILIVQPHAQRAVA